MTDSRPGGGRLPGIQNDPLRLGQQRARRDENQHVGRGSPNPTDDAKNNLWIMIEKSIKLQDRLKQLTELCGKLEKSNSNVRTLSEDNKNLKKQIDELITQLEDCKSRLVEAVQNYENAKVVVLTYKTRNIHLETAAEELEVRLTVMHVMLQLWDYVTPNISMRWLNHCIHHHTVI